MRDEGARVMIAMFYGRLRKVQCQHSTIRGMVIEGRRHLPAAPAEVALKLSWLAWNLRRDAAGWGHPCPDSRIEGGKP